MRDERRGQCFPRVSRSERDRGPEECRDLRAGQDAPSSSIALLSLAAAILLWREDLLTKMSQKSWAVRCRLVTVLREARAPCTNALRSSAGLNIPEGRGRKQESMSQQVYTAGVQQGSLRAQTMFTIEGANHVYKEWHLELLAHIMKVVEA